MEDFILQILATLVSTFIIFVATKLWKFLRKVPINFWHSLLFVIFVFFAYLFNVNSQVMNLKILLELTKLDSTYIVALISLSISTYTTVFLSVFIKNEFFPNKFNKNTN